VITLAKALGERGAKPRAARKARCSSSNRGSSGDAGGNGEVGGEVVLHAAPQASHVRVLEAGCVAGVGFEEAFPEDEGAVLGAGGCPCSGCGMGMGMGEHGKRDMCSSPCTCDSPQRTITAKALVYRASKRATTPRGMRHTSSLAVAGSIMLRV